MSDIIDLTMNYWLKENLNCARSTAAGLLKFNGDNSYEDFNKAFVPFGGGILSGGNSCGAVVGSFAALSKLLYDQGIKEKVISEKIKDLKDLFIEKYGSIDCKSILSEFSSVDGIDFYHPERKPKCTIILSEIVKNSQNIIDNLN